VVVFEAFKRWYLCVAALIGLLLAVAISWRWWWGIPVLLCQNSVRRRRPRQIGCSCRLAAGSICRPDRDRYSDGM